MLEGDPCRAKFAPTKRQELEGLQLDSIQTRWFPEKDGKKTVVLLFLS